MTYLEFHLWFNLPSLALLFWLVRKRLRWTHVKCIAILCGIVFAATAPWDNWAVHRGFWDFDWRRVNPVTVTLAGIQWRLPAEEYAFFLIETVQVSLLTLLCLPTSAQISPVR